VITCKRCSKCGEDKPLTDFHRRSAGADGYQAWCKACSLASVKKYQKKVGKSIVHRSVRYGLTPDEVASMLRIPQCQACGSPFSDAFEQKFDHCHTHGHFRGVLCHACNMACQGESPLALTRLARCIEYLHRDIEREQTRAS